MMKKNISSLSLIIALVAVFFVGCSNTESKIRFQAMYLDMDGTALTPDHEVRPATVEALNAYRSCGGRIGIATGRTLEQVRPFLDDLKPNLPLVLFNGGVIVDPSGKEVLFNATMDSEVAKDVVKHAADDGVKGVFVNYSKETLLDRRDAYMEAFLKRADISKVQVCSDLVACVEEREKTKGELPIKILFVVVPSMNEGIAAKIKESVGDKARAILAHEEAIAVIAKGVDKINSIKRILVQNDLKPEDVVVFGDSNNDTRMVGEIPVSIAMGNCRPNTCEAALFTIGTNDTDSIARVIRRLVLMDKCKGS